MYYITIRSLFATFPAMKEFNPTLYFITDSTCVAENRFLPVVEAACRGGATIVQLREKDRSTREYMELARATHEITARYGIPLIIDDRVDVALAIGAEGVHVGQSDMPVRLARSLMGNSKIVGATTKTVPQALEAFEQGADYLGCGAIYPTTTHVKTVITPVETLKRRGKSGTHSGECHRRAQQGQHLRAERFGNRRHMRCLRHHEGRRSGGCHQGTQAGISASRG